MKVRRVAATNEELLDERGAPWAKLEARKVDLVPAPVVMTMEISRYLALSQGHGAVKAVSARMAHNGETLSIRVS